MAGLSDLKSNPPVAMTMGAFAGIAWFICTELIVLFITTFKRYRGLYFWSCLLSSLGVILHPLTILMADFGIWTNLKVSITLIVLTWVLMVIPHSFVLYSRLHLVMHSTRKLRWIFYMIVINSIVMTPPTIVLGILAVSTIFTTPTCHRTNQKIASLGLSRNTVLQQHDLESDPVNNVRFSRVHYLSSVRVGGQQTH